MRGREASRVPAWQWRSVFSLTLFFHGDFNSRTCGDERPKYCCSVLYYKKICHTPKGRPKERVTGEAEEDAGGGRTQESEATRGHRRFYTLRCPPH